MKCTDGRSAAGGRAVEGESRPAVSEDVERAQRDYDAATAALEAWAKRYGEWQEALDLFDDQSNAKAILLD